MVQREVCMNENFFMMFIDLRFDFFSFPPLKYSLQIDLKKEMACDNNDEYKIIGIVKILKLIDGDNKLDQH